MRFHPTKLVSLAAIIVMAGLVFAVPLSAQNRILKGKVTDDKDQPIVGANVTIMGIDVKREYKVKTDKRGEYFYMGIPFGVYRIVVRAKGFQPDYIENIRPSLGQETENNFKLNPGEDRKLAYELTPEEVEKLKQDQAKIEKAREASKEVRSIFDGGLALAQEGKYAAAAAEFRKALEMDAEQPYIWANLADALSKNDELEPALEAYQKAIALKPDDAAMHTNLGVLLGRMGKSAESQEAFKKAASINPGAAGQNFYNLGATLVNGGKTAEAVEAFRQAIAADPNFAEAYYQLGICLSGNPATMAEAIQMLQKYTQMGKNAEQVEVAKQLIEALKPQVKP